MTSLSQCDFKTMSDCDVPEMDSWYYYFRQKDIGTLRFLMRFFTKGARFSKYILSFHLLLKTKVRALMMQNSSPYFLGSCCLNVKMDFYHPGVTS